MFANGLSATLLLLSSLSLTKGCQTEIAFEHSYSSCRFIVSYPTGDCYNFNFQECQYQTCQQHESGSGCIRSQTTTSTSYSYCTYQCCDPSVSYYENWGSIEQCQDYLKDMAEARVIFVVCFLGAIGLFFVIVVFCLWLYKKRRQLKCPRFSRKEEKVEVDQDNKIQSVPSQNKAVRPYYHYKSKRKCVRKVVNDLESAEEMKK